MNSGSINSALDRKFLPQGQNFLFDLVIVSAKTSDNLYFGLEKNGCFIEKLLFFSA